MPTAEAESLTRAARTRPPVASRPAPGAPAGLGQLIGNRALARMLTPARQAVLARCDCHGPAPSGPPCSACAGDEHAVEEELAPPAAVRRQSALARQVLARACAPAADCAVPQASLTDFVVQTEAKPENVSKASKRAADCAAKKPACTSDGHAAVATALTSFLRDRAPARLRHISGIFVNKDMPADWGAVTMGCSGFTPPLPENDGKKLCVTVPDTLEAEAKVYLGGQAKTVGGVAPSDWVTQTLTTLYHETEHARFDTAAADAKATPLKGPASGSCTPADVESDLSELAAQMSEFPIVLRRIQRFPEAVRKRRLDAWFQYHLSNGSEDVTGTLKTLRCKCECSEVNRYVRQVVGFTQGGWSSYERFVYHTEMKRPVHKLDWPVDPPDSVDVNDLPAATATP